MLSLGKGHCRFGQLWLTVKMRISIPWRDGTASTCLTRCPEIRSIPLKAASASKLSAASSPAEIVVVAPCVGYRPAIARSVDLRSKLRVTTRKERQRPQRTRSKAANNPFRQILNLLKKSGKCPVGKAATEWRAFMALIGRACRQIDGLTTVAKKRTRVF
jgi:hypothetical protein